MARRQIPPGEAGSARRLPDAAVGTPRRGRDAPPGETPRRGVSTCRWTEGQTSEQRWQRESEPGPTMTLAQAVAMTPPSQGLRQGFERTWGDRRFWWQDCTRREAGVETAHRAQRRPTGRRDGPPGRLYRYRRTIGWGGYRLVFVARLYDGAMRRTSGRRPAGMAPVDSVRRLHYTDNQYNAIGKGGGHGGDPCQHRPGEA